MSNYLLYGDKMIENDSTMKDFAKSICRGVPAEFLNLNKESFQTEFINIAIEILEDDISRTDIDYAELMHKYRSELGDLLYEIENNGGEIPLIKFFGEEAKDSFNRLIKEYLEIYFNELVGVVL